MDHRQVSLESHESRTYIYVYEQSLKIITKIIYYDSRLQLFPALFLWRQNSPNSATPSVHLISTLELKVQRCTLNAASPHFPRSAARLRAWPLFSGRFNRAVIDSPVDADPGADRLRCVTTSQSDVAEKVPDSTIDLLTRAREPIYRCAKGMVACV